jgi:hypothetical protein
LILRLAAGGEDFEELVAGDTLAAANLGHAFLQPEVEGGLADLKPFFFGLEQVQCVGDNLGRLPIVPRSSSRWMRSSVAGSRARVMGKYTPGLRGDRRVIGEAITSALDL